MNAHSPVETFLAGWSACHRHPARRARGSCERCGLDYCTPCLFPAHDCAALLPGRIPGAPLWPVAGTGLALAGVLIVWSLPPKPNTGLEPRQLRNQPLPETPVRAALSAPVRTPPGEQASSAPEPPAAAPAPRALPTPQHQPPAAKVATPMNQVAQPAAATTRPQAPPSPPRPVKVPLSSFDRGPREHRALLLTVDAGARAAGAESILDALAAASLKTTFFITGEFIRNHPALVMRMVEEGHEIGNHTETHLHLTLWAEEGRHRTRPEVTRERLQGELTRTHEAFKQLTGRSMAPLWRAPYGEHNREILAWAAALGWRHVGWTPRMDTLDWVTDQTSKLYRTPEEIARNLLTFPDRDPHKAHGAIILMHLGSERPVEERLGRVLPRIIAGYREQGFEFLTASAMLDDAS